MSKKEFADLMSGIPSHSDRMKEAARMGREGYKLPNVEEEGPFSATYAIVCLMAGKDVEGLETVVRKHRSWPIRARALQCLSKLDQSRLARLLTDPTLPVQMRSIILKSLNVGDENILNTVLSNQSWGGIEAAIELLRRLPRGEVYEELLKTWLPKLGSMNRLLGQTIKKKHDEEYLYQSAAAKYPKLMIEKLKNEKGDIDFRWYRASKVLAAEHPDELVEILKEKSWNPRAVWFIARPLIKHRPDEVCAIFKERKIVDDGLFWCLRTVFHSTTHRRILLDIVLENLKYIPSDTSDRLIKLLTRKCQGMFRVDTELTELHLSKYNVDWLKLLSDLSESSPYKLTVEVYKKCLNKHVMAKKPTQASIKKIAAKLGMSRADRDAVWTSIHDSDLTGPKITVMVQQQSLISKGMEHNFYNTIPRTMRDKILVDYSVTEEYLEKEMQTRCNLLSQIPYDTALKTLKILSNDTAPSNRVVGLKTLWMGAVKRQKVDEIKDVCNFIHGKIKRDHEEVTSPVIRQIILETPAELLVPLVEDDLLMNLFTVSLGLTSLHSDGWAEWCAKVFVRPIYEGEAKYKKLAEKLVERVEQERTLKHSWPNLVVKALQNCRKEIRAGAMKPHSAEHLGRIIDAIEEACKKAEMFVEYTSRTEEQTSRTTVPASLLNRNYTSSVMRATEVLDCWNHRHTLEIFRFYGTDLLMVSPHARRHATMYLKKLVYKNTSPVAAALVLDISSLPEARLLLWPQYSVFVKKALTSLIDLSKVNAVGYNNTDGRVFVASIVSQFLQHLPLVSTTQAKVLFKNGVSSKLAATICKYSMPYESFWEQGCETLSSCCVHWKGGIPTSFVPDTHSKEKGRKMMNNEDRNLLNTIHTVINDVTTKLIDLLQWRADNVKGITAGLIAASATPQHLCQTMRSISFKGPHTAPTATEAVAVFCRSEIPLETLRHFSGTNLFGLEAKNDDYDSRETTSQYHRGSGRAVRNRFTRGADAKKRIVRRTARRNEEFLSRKCYGADDMILLLEKLKTLDTSEGFILPRLIHAILYKIAGRKKRRKESDIHPSYYNLLKKCIQVTSEFEYSAEDRRRFDSCYRLIGELSHFTTFPEAYEAILKRAGEEDPNCLLYILQPEVTKRARMLQLLTTGVPGMEKFSASAREIYSPQRCFNKSRDIQQFVFKHRQDLLLDLIPGIDSSDNYFGCFQQPLRKIRFAGQEYSVEGLFTLSPPCQQAVYQYLLKFFNINTDIEITEGYHRRSSRHWLAEANVLCALTDVPELEGLDREDHPFRKLLEDIIQKKVEWGDQDLPATNGTGLDKELPNYKEGCALLEGMIKSRELLVALRAYHDQEQAIGLVQQHLDIGLVEKVCIPSISNLLRTISPTRAAEVLTTIFDRQETKVAARSQLCRSVVHCLGALHQKEAVRLIRQESRVDIANKTADKGVFVSLTNALASSSLLRQSPSLWDVMEYIKQDPPTEESRYVATQLLRTLSGNNNVRSLNVPYWPYDACPGLAGLCSNFVGKGALDEHAVTALDRWLEFVMATPTHVVDDADAVEVVAAMKNTTNSDLMTRVCLALSQNGHPEAIGRVVSGKMDLLKKAFESHDITAAKGVLDILSGLSVTKRRHLVACEFGAQKAAEVLLSNISTRQFGFRLLAGMIDFKNPDVGSDGLFKAFHEAGWDSLIALMAAVKEAYTSQNSPRNHLQRKVVKYLQAQEGSTNLNSRLMTLLLINSVTERDTPDVKKSLFKLMQDPESNIAIAAIDLFPRPEAAGFEEPVVRTVV
eukprot:TRINITY_DN9352_c0_g1_i1.p1 TRINITY_DN9352_c0_g1~~TRINITY_DN9352_c0_g1_i1.p1  ORF type:complete len:1786 (+),score=357.87 TRINITY_DN9352_c0_g1_i1:52-5358(+)